MHSIPSNRQPLELEPKPHKILRKSINITLKSQEPKSHSKSHIEAIDSAKKNTDRNPQQQLRKSQVSSRKHEAQKSLEISRRTRGIHNESKLSHGKYSAVRRSSSSNLRLDIDNRLKNIYCIVNNQKSNKEGHEILNSYGLNTNERIQGAPENPFANLNNKNQVYEKLPYHLMREYIDTIYSEYEIKNPVVSEDKKYSSYVNVEKTPSKHLNKTDRGADQSFLMNNLSTKKKIQQLKSNFVDELNHQTGSVHQGTERKKTNITLKSKTSKHGVPVSIDNSKRDSNFIKLNLSGVKDKPHNSGTYNDGENTNGNNFSKVSPNTITIRPQKMGPPSRLLGSYQRQYSQNIGQYRSKLPQQTTLMEESSIHPLRDPNQSGNSIFLGHALSDLSHSQLNGPSASFLNETQRNNGNSPNSPLISKPQPDYRATMNTLSQTGHHPNHVTHIRNYNSINVFDDGRQRGESVLLVSQSKEGAQLHNSEPTEIPQLFRYCFVCEEPILEYNLHFHEKSCRRLHELLSSTQLTPEDLLKMMDDKVSSISGQIQAIVLRSRSASLQVKDGQVDRSEEDGNRKDHVQFGESWNSIRTEVEKWLGLIQESRKPKQAQKESDGESIQKSLDHYSVIESQIQKSNIVKSLELFNKLNWFLHLKNNFQKHLTTTQTSKGISINKLQNQAL